MRTLIGSGLALLVWSWSPEAARACAVCFGNQDSPMTHGLNAGILFLLGVMGMVLASFAAFFVYLWWRSRHPLLETAALEPTQ